MKIGVISSSIDSPMGSIGHVVRSTIEALQPEHELTYRPSDYAYCSTARQKDALKEILLSCDVLMGTVEDLVLEVRQEINKQIPYCCFMLGFMPRGNIVMMNNYHLFRTNDVLLVNCTSDLKIANKFFENAQVRLLPFCFKEADFYPLDEASKQALRATLGFNSEDKILIYSGRITIEKNVHSVLRIFSVIQKLVPHARLIVAGTCRDVPFFEFGAYPVNTGNTLEKIIAKLGIDQDKVRFIGHKEKTDLCGLYNIADVVINMTLHHDENFGLSQVEAMACGTPVIGANWGGLKDTIVDGVTGYKVSTTVTASGIKLNWWEAIIKIVSLLQNESKHSQLRQQCTIMARNKYSLSKYRENLRSALIDCHEKMNGVSEPLKASEFARQLWNSRTSVNKYGSSPYHLYKELITSYTGTSQNYATIDQWLKPTQVVCLATPLINLDEESIEINDPIFPISITIPAIHKKVTRIVVEAMKEEPVITMERLIDHYLAGQANITDALEWMIEAGLILKGGPESKVLSARSISSQMSLPLFSFQRIDPATDVFILPALFK
jgi:glycosyltransferase involved in cell wall biosynthesis